MPVVQWAVGLVPASSSSGLCVRVGAGMSCMSEGRAVQYQVLPAVTFAQAWSSFWANLFNFKGRATRAEYWWVVLVAVVSHFVLSLPLAALPLLGALLSVVFVLLVLGVTVRRFHDAGWGTTAAVFLVLSSLVLLVAGLAVALTSLGALFEAGFKSSMGGSLDGVTAESIFLGLLAGTVSCAVGSGLGVVVLAVTVLPSKGDNDYGLQRAGRVAAPAPVSDPAPDFPPPAAPANREPGSERPFLPDSSA